MSLFLIPQTTKHHGQRDYDYLPTRKLVFRVVLTTSEDSIKIQAETDENMILTRTTISSLPSTITLTIILMNSSTGELRQIANYRSSTSIAEVSMQISFKSRSICITSQNHSASLPYLRHGLLQIKA